MEKNREFWEKRLKDAVKLEKEVNSSYFITRICMCSVVLFMFVGFMTKCFRITLPLQIFFLGVQTITWGRTYSKIKKFKKEIE